jgi:hypothetical protein
MAWAILLPAGIIFAWLAVPNQVPVKLLKGPSQELLPLIIKSKDTKDFSINIRSNKENTQWQLEWKNKTVLMVPSAVIYKASLNPSEGGASDSFMPGKADLIGRIETKGDYIFPLKTDSTRVQQLHFILYDFIHEKTIESINF